MDWRLPAAIVLAALGLQACDRQGITEVQPPKASSPDDTSLKPRTETRLAQVAGPASTLPTVRDPGDTEGARLLAQKRLQIPVLGASPTSLSDQYAQGRTGHMHEAIDILAPAGTPVVAVDDGRIAKLFTSKPGGLTIYQFDPDTHLAYYYAHLQGYAPGLQEGMEVKRGDLIGYVGSTGNADAKTPHLHFTVFRLGTPPKWWEGEAVNPYPALTRAQPTTQLAQR
jgi:murein DD-endopeptidase MepM/ murein hydrolase activator NlpD